MLNISDEKLIKAAIAGDTEAKETLKERIKSIALTAMQKNGIQDSTENAKTLTDEIEQKVLDALHQFRFRVSLETWVYRITVNQVLVKQRKEIKQQTITQNQNGSPSRT